ncbi:MAG: 3'-5' exonuclease [Cytophagales bacterium]|nr:MAG: 3'-5' exonuclease [Cytophagales bacterium]
MFSDKELSNILFLDIETARSHYQLNELSEGMQKMWEHKAQMMDKDSEQTPQEKYKDKAAIFAEFGRVVCISVALIHFVNNEPHLKLKSYYGENENEILLQFKELLDQKLDPKKYPNLQLAAHNGKEFDYPYLCRRLLINQIQLPKILQIQNKKPWEVQLLDTMEMWKFGDKKNFTKLELLCHIFDIPSPKDNIDGSQVGEYFWERKEYKTIAQYCEKDVVATAQLIMKYSLKPLIKEENIEYSL